jgi:hypothetical protein
MLSIGNRYIGVVVKIHVQSELYLCTASVDPKGVQ